MIPKFRPDRLVEVREKAGLNKAETSRLLGMSPMGYLRYEQGIRVPSVPILEHIAVKLQTSVRYLTGMTKDPSPDIYYVSRYDEEALFQLISELRKEGDDEDSAEELLEYYLQNHSA